MANFYALKADEVEVWSGRRMPTADEIQKAGNKAGADGWNGTRLDLFRNGKLIDNPVWYAEGDPRKV